MFVLQYKTRFGYEIKIHIHTHTHTLNRKLHYKYNLKGNFIIQTYSINTGN